MEHLATAPIGVAKGVAEAGESGALHALSGAAHVEGDIASLDALFTNNLMIIPAESPTIIDPLQRIVRPEPGLIKVGSEIDFVYVMRKDGDYTMNPFSQRLAERHNLDPRSIQGDLVAEYDTFSAKLIETLHDAYSSTRGTVQIHVFSEHNLEKQTLKEAGDLPLISYDPLLTGKDILSFESSRGWYPGGRVDMGRRPRPGAAPLDQQARHIKEVLGDREAAVGEDDVYTGGSLAGSIETKLNEGVNIGLVIPGIQFGEPSKIKALGLPIKPIVLYETTDGRAVEDVFDLGDPRDFMVGASGLVVQLPDRSFGRAPYVSPFVSTEARASIPSGTNKEFGLKVLKANLDFFSAVQERVGHPLLLADMDPYFVHYMSTLHNIPSDAPMTDVISWSMDHIDEIWNVTNELGKQEKRIAEMNLPDKMVFLDVHGTVLPDGSRDGILSELDIRDLRTAASRLENAGVSVGLNSHAPLESLQELAQRIGLKNPVCLFEGGNGIYYNNKTEILRQLNQAALDEIRIRIEIEAQRTEHERIADMPAPEFGGNPIPFMRGDTFAYEKGRQASLAVFADREFIDRLGVKLADLSDQFGLFVRPELKTLVVLPKDGDFRNHKRETLELLAAHGHSVLMVGDNAEVDAVDVPGATSAFVSSSKLTPKLRAEQEVGEIYVSKKPDIRGVIDILSQIQV